MKEDSVLFRICRSCVICNSGCMLEMAQLSLQEWIFPCTSGPTGLSPGASVTTSQAPPVPDEHEKLALSLLIGAVHR